MPQQLGIVGPTATGKSEIAHRVAARLGDVEIVTVDSMQVYRGMDIGTAKPTRVMRTEVAYHLIDIADPTDEFTVRDFQLAATAAIEDIAARRRRPLLVGGTGLYLRAVVDDLEIPRRYPEVRAGLDDEEDLAVLYARLEALDPVAAGRMDPHNRRRIVRALEVCIGSGRRFSSYGDGLDTYPDTDWDLVGLDPGKEVVNDRIEQRYRRQLEEGFLDEVRSLTTNARPLGRTAAQALGYRQMAAHLRGEATLAEALDAAVAATRRFARRQRSWFRRDPRLEWIDIDPDEGVDHVVDRLVQRWTTTV